MISVCIATHNGEKYIKKQLDSILCQLGKDDEVIISDDGSVDNTMNLIQSIHDNRLKLYNYKQVNHFSHKNTAFFYYASANFYNALQKAKGDIIFLADQDDIWPPNKVSIFLAHFERYDIVCSNCSVIDDNDRLITACFFEKGKFKKLNFFQVIKNLPFRGCCLAFKKHVLENAMPFPKKLLLHDCWIGLNAYVGNYKYFFIDEPLLRYRRHSANVSREVSPHSIFFKFSYRIRLLIQILVLQIRRLNMLHIKMNRKEC
jgi:glycosyltransferase involved in cell wall biosynthesis